MPAIHRKNASSDKRTWKVHLSVESRKLGIPSSWIKKLLTQVLHHVESDIAIPEVCEIHVALTDDARIQVLNKEYRNKDKATDVLSFPQFHPKEISGRSRRRVEAPGPYLGDLVISTETTLKQAKEFGVTKREELARLVVHGVLHLCGYDHEKVPAADAQRMRRRERYIRSRLVVR